MRAHQRQAVGILLLALPTDCFISQPQPSSIWQSVPLFAVTGEPAQQEASHFFSRKALDDPSFAADEMLEGLCQGAGLERPSKIQSLAWPVLLKGSNAIIADQTGSGKTLAYLVPLLRRALAMERPKNLDGAPRILVLAPTAELADQVRAVCDKLSAAVKFSTMVVTADGRYNTSIRDQIRRIQRQSMDVLISTPGRLSTILRTRNSGLDLSYLSAIVMDEVDVLLIDDTFGEQLRTVGAAAPLDRTQFVFVTATLPDSIVETVSGEFPDVVQVRGPGLHRVAPTVSERLVDVSVPAQYNRDKVFCFDVKAKQLLKALRQTKCRRTLVFCNTVESCRQVENLLKRRDRKGQIYDVRAYHSAMTADARNENLAIFSKSDESSTDYILVCTDRAARGVDFEASPVDHVILFDFPKDPAEYLRRVGRTSRAGRQGTSTVFAYGWQLPIARSVMGSKLDSFEVAMGNPNEDEEDAYDFRGGAKKRRKGGSIKDNIEGGKMWTDTKR